MLLSKTATSFEMIMVGRFLYGINAGEPTVRGNPFPLSLFLFSLWLIHHFWIPSSPHRQSISIYTCHHYTSKFARPFVFQLLILIDPFRMYDSLVCARRSQSLSSHHIPCWMRAQDSASDGGCDHRHLRLLWEVLWSAAGVQVRCHRYCRESGRVKSRSGGGRVQTAALTSRSEDRRLCKKGNMSTQLPHKMLTMYSKF